MTVTGLNSDLYYSNNPILITFNGINANTKYIDLFANVGGKASNKPQRLYVFGQTSITIDISQNVKSYYPEVIHNTDYTTITPFVISNNWTRVTFVIKEVLNNGTQNYVPTITKTFVRGGNRVYDSNQNAGINNYLSPTNILPQWGGYPLAYYYFNSSKEILKANKLPVGSREIRKVKGCDPLYLKFLNSKGGYSYWLFENWETEEKNKNLGVIKGNYSLRDLGNETENDITATSKVPRRFMPLMFDLADSQEIYKYNGNNLWERITSDGNKVSQNTFNTNEKVKLKFQRHHRYNPSLIW